MMDSKRRKSTNCNGQASRGAVLDLPQEIIFDIFSRLPIESILTCRVVCKTWNAVTQDPCFINELGNSHCQSTRLILKPLLGENISDALSHLLLLDIEERKTRRIPFEKVLADLQIMSSCNGLLCMASAKNLDPVVIYNPITREHLILPSSSHLKSAIISHHEVGLGFDPSTDKYKVVRAYCYSSSRSKFRKFEIISVGERSWRELSAPWSLVKRDSYEVVFWDGALYWRVHKGAFFIFQFDLSDEKFLDFSFPDFFSPDGASLGLIDVGGCLTLVQNEDSVVELWRLTGNKVGGDLSVCLQDTHDTHVKWGGGLRCEFICQMNQESYLLKVGFWNCLRQCQEHLTQYFPKKTQYSNLEISGLPSSFQTICFKPSLAPLPSGLFCSL